MYIVVPILLYELEIEQGVVVNQLKECQFGFVPIIIVFADEAALLQLIQRL